MSPIKEFSFSRANEGKIEFLRDKIFNAFVEAERPAIDNIALHDTENYCVGEPEK